jgi:hypothetical protein
MYPKFIWMPAVLEEARFTEAERIILTYCALQYINGSENSFCVRQATVAEKLHVSRRSVIRAYASARQLGYLKTAEERQRGRGYHQADVHVLTLPNGHPRWAMVEQEIGDAPVTNSQEYVTDQAGIGDTTDPWTGEYVTHQTGIGDTAVTQYGPLTSENTPPKCLEEGYREQKKGLEEGTSTFVADDEEKIIDGEIVDEEVNPSTVADVFGGLFNRTRREQKRWP